VATVIRHAIAEGWELVRHHTLVGLTLACALAVPLSLAGLTYTVSRWLGPLVELGEERSAVAVLLHPQMNDEQRAQWLADQTRLHPGWRIRAVPPEQLSERLTRWFPYLADILKADGSDLLPPLVEVTTDEPESVAALLTSPSVIAVGPRSTLQHLIGRTVERLEWTLLAISAVLLASAALLAGGWVHVELYRHADEITIMRLLGATEPAIRGPFLVAALAPGVLAAVMAVSGTAVLSSVWSRLAGFVGLPRVVPGWQVLTCEGFIACVLPVLAAYLTLSRHTGDQVELE
jgi:cell division transport system permease protein